MRSAVEFIVKIDNARHDKIQMKNGSFLYLSPVAYEGYDIQTRVGVVESTPEMFDVKVRKGDKVFFHHNITKESQFYGNKIYSDFKIKDNLYRIPATEIYGYLRNDEFHALDPYVFVEPTEQDEVIRSGIIVEQAKEHRNEGIIRYPNEELKKQGIKSGDKVLFSKYSKYQLGISDKDERLFRMKTDWIVAKINE